MSELKEAINFSHLGIPPVLIMTWLAFIILLVLSIIATAKLKKAPGMLQNIFETVFEFVFDLVDSIMGSEGKRFYPLFLGIFLFIFVSNTLGLIPGLVSPTASLNTTIALALVVFFYYHIIGVQKFGLIKYIKHFTGDVPVWLKPFMFIIEIVSHLSRPVSLSFRLFGNMTAKEILLMVLPMLLVLFFPSSLVVQKVLTIVPVLLLPFIYLLGCLVVLIQAFVFMMLSIFYINGALADHGHKEEDHNIEENSGKKTHDGLENKGKTS